MELTEEQLIKIEEELHKYITSNRILDDKLEQIVSVMTIDCYSSILEAIDVERETITEEQEKDIEDAIRVLADHMLYTYDHDNY